jgi:hypothetical protein
MFVACAEGNPVRPVKPDGGGVGHPMPPSPYPRPTYQHLSETGFFGDFAAGTISPDVVAFEPAYPLWSDGAEKRRWMRLPPGTQIDATDMDHWIFPVGTKFWKEFSHDGIRLETRLVERYGEGPEDYWMGAFVWNLDQNQATFAIYGEQNLLGTLHDAPAQKDCGACHRGDMGRVLGFSAIQLSEPPNDPTLSSLFQQGRLATALEVPPTGYPVPGDPVTKAALGYLHANCGHCHNQNGTSWPDTQMVLRLQIADREAETSGVFRSLVEKPLQYWRGGATTFRVIPGDPEASAIVDRMQLRGSKDQMPSLATEMVDPVGLAIVRHWIAGLSRL